MHDTAAAPHATRRSTTQSMADFYAKPAVKRHTVFTIWTNPGHGRSHVAESVRMPIPHTGGHRHVSGAAATAGTAPAARSAAATGAAAAAGAAPAAAARSRTAGRARPGVAATAAGTAAAAPAGAHPGTPRHGHEHGSGG